MDFIFDFEMMYDEVTKFNDKQRKKFNENYVKKINQFSPTGIGGCMRKAELKQMGVSGDEEISLKLQKIFDFGNLIHDDFVFKVIKRYLEDVKHMKNITVINEYPFNSRYEYKDTYYTIKGFIDDLFMIKEHGKSPVLIPVEVKSIGGKFYQLKEPLAKHVVQIQSYLDDLDVDEGWLLYISKTENLMVKQFKITRDQEMMGKIRKRIEKHMDYRMEGIMPPAEGILEKDDPWLKDECDWCEFGNFCSRFPLEAFKSEDEEDEIETE